MREESGNSVLTSVSPGILWGIWGSVRVSLTTLLISNKKVTSNLNEINFNFF